MSSLWEDLAGTAEREQVAQAMVLQDLHSRDHRYASRLMPGAEYVDDEALLEERDKEIELIHHQMEELHPIYCEIARLVEEQGEQVESIQTLIAESAASVEAAKAAVSEANESQKEKRKNTAIVAGTGVGIGALIIGIVTLKFLH